MSARFVIAAFSSLLLTACGSGLVPDPSGNPTKPSPEAVDADQDGFGADVDCDDFNNTVNPDADEVCDEIDNDCDGDIDADDESLIDGLTFYTDADGDGFGDESTATVACSQPPELVDQAGDCDDSNEAVNPDAVERCLDGVDTDCDGEGDGPCVVCSDIDVLIYTDDAFAIGAVSFYREAANNLGMSAQGMSDPDAFESEVGQVDYDLVVVDLIDEVITGGARNGLDEQIAQGRRVALSYWDLDNHPGLQTALQVGTQESLVGALALEAATGSPVFNVIEQPPSPLLPTPTGLFGDNGDVLEPVDPSTAEVLAVYADTTVTFPGTTTYSGDYYGPYTNQPSAPNLPSMVLANNGQFLVTGFLPRDYLTADADGDGKIDVTELLENTLQYWFDCETGRQ